MFLGGHEAREFRADTPSGITPHELFLGQGGAALEVVVFTATRQPTQGELQQLHDKRKGGRASPVVVAVLWGVDRAAISTSTGLEPFTHRDLERGQVERLLDAALRAPTNNVAARHLVEATTQLGLAIPGLRNSGLFAYHVLEHRASRLDEWHAALREGRSLLDARGRELVGRLGFRVESSAAGGATSILVASGSRLAVAVFLDRTDEIDASTPLFDHLSPVSYALHRADRENLDFVVVTAASRIRVYPVKLGAGTGRRGRTETFVELDLSMLREEHAALVPLLVSAKALTAEGTFHHLLDASREFAVGLGERLRDRVYEDVVPQLAAAIVKGRRLRSPSADKLAETYEMALLVLFRLLFVAYAEDKELLPLHSSPSYRAHSLKEMALRLMRERETNTEYGKGAHYWTEVNQLWAAIDRGNPAWHVPEYNGGLFASGDDARGSAQALGRLELPDDAFAPALQSLLLDESAEGGLGPIDFRTLGVREFGTIYEGLLEQELAVAEQDLSVDKKTGAYVPVKGKGVVVVREGQVYLHNASGARKASGAYYTKDFAVEHLLEHALDPALDDHLNRIAGVQDDREASERFFDFHVADIAMGSGHFLVAAIDHMERKFSGYLARRALPGVKDELNRLRKTAEHKLGADYRGDPLEDTQLLRRQIARRCVFGVDINPLAVELARLSIWIHTFVPGLPLSFLDQNLVCGNALVGIATLDDVRALLGYETAGLFAENADTLLGSAREPLRQLARLADATAAEVKEAQRLHKSARAAIRPTEELFTVLTAAGLDVDARPIVERKRATSGGTIGAAISDHQVHSGMTADIRQRLLARAEKALKGLRVLHFPVVFPQVFLGHRPGFDVILGNPPWEKARVEELEFWARHFPGLRALGTAAREARLRGLRRSRGDLCDRLEAEKAESLALRNALRGTPGMNTGHPDLFRAFTWRFLTLTAGDAGRLGVVLPGEAFKVRGARTIREILVEHTSLLDVRFGTNRSYWLFEGVDSRKLVAFVVAKRGRGTGTDRLLLRPEVHTRRAWDASKPDDIVERDAQWWRRYSSGLVLPILPSSAAVELLERLMRFPRLREHSEYPVARVYADFETTRDVARWHSERAKGDWPVYKGESFDLWTPDTGSYFGYASGQPIARAVFERVQRAPAGSPYARLDASIRADHTRLAVTVPRIAFRDVTNRTNQRTLVTALIPPKVVTTQTAPWVLWCDGSAAKDREAVLLGCLSSLVVDWWVRRFVEGHVDQEAFESIPIPSTGAATELRRVVEMASARLATPDDRFEEWASHFDLEPRALPDDEKEDLINELDAAVAHLYGLDDRDLAHIFETFHEGWDYESRLQRTLKHFRRLAGLR